MIVLGRTPGLCDAVFDCLFEQVGGRCSMSLFRNRRTRVAPEIGDGVARRAEGERLHHYFVAGPTPQAISARCTAAVPPTVPRLCCPAVLRPGVGSQNSSRSFSNPLTFTGAPPSSGRRPPLYNPFHAPTCAQGRVRFFP